jgi:Ca2+-binding RTX toxin-like protein
MPITGTTGNDIIDGTSGADEIFGLAGNDTINGLEGNDTIYGGLGNDTLNGGDGDDLFVEDEATTAADFFNGGAGIDTIELRVIPNPVIAIAGPTSVHAMPLLNSLTSIERLVFASQPGSTIQGVVMVDAVPGSGLTEVVAGAGRDFMAFITGQAGGTFTVPTLTYTGFAVPSINSWESTFSDSIILVATTAPGNNATLNAASGLNVLQALIGGLGNDTLNGSANGDILNGAAGINQLFGNGGNDSLAIVNQYTQNNQGGFNPPNFFTGSGSTLDGGDGTDVLTIGGYVELAATLVSIEGVVLQPGFTPPFANTPGQQAAYLWLYGDQIAMLPSNAFFSGTGNVAFVPDDGTSLSLANYVLTPGHSLTFEIFAGVKT